MGLSKFRVNMVLYLLVNAGTILTSLQRLPASSQRPHSPRVRERHERLQSLKIPAIILKRRQIVNIFQLPRLTRRLPSFSCSQARFLGVKKPSISVGIIAVGRMAFTSVDGG